MIGCSRDPGTIGLDAGNRNAVKDALSLLPFPQFLAHLCAFKSAGEELTRHDDLKLLFSAVTSWCPPHNAAWKKVAHEVLMAISHHSLTPLVQKYIHGKAAAGSLFLALGVGKVQHLCLFRSESAASRQKSKFGFLFNQTPIVVRSSASVCSCLFICLCSVIFFSLPSSSSSASDHRTLQLHSAPRKEYVLLTSLSSSPHSHLPLPPSHRPLISPTNPAGVAFPISKPPNGATPVEASPRAVTEPFSSIRSISQGQSCHLEAEPGVFPMKFR